MNDKKKGLSGETGCKMEVTIAGVTLKNPVMTASGTFGSGMEYASFGDLSQLGAIVTKGVAAVPWPGNPVPRIAETPSGMLNAIGLQNPGAETFCSRDLPFLEGYDTRVVVNVCGHTEEEYCRVVERLSDERPGSRSASRPSTRSVKRLAKQPVIMKLSPNVTDIAVMGRAAEEAGADGISLINTLLGMKIDIHRRAFVLANRTGGLSGPAIHPVAVRMVYEAAHAVHIPVIGMGGIMNADDAIELMMAGATAVSVGTASFTDPLAAFHIVRGIADFAREKDIRDIHEIIGVV